MGMKSSSDEPRIVLWRRAIRLFKQYRGVSGPFFEAGITEYRIESKLGKNKLTPDILCWDPEDTDRAFFFELTLNNEDKTEQISKYKGLDTLDLLPEGIQTKNPPDVILGVFNENPADVFQFILGDELSYINFSKINDERFAKCVKDKEGIDLVRISELLFTFVPESKKMELRRGMIPSIKKIFEPDGEGLSADDIVRDGLDFLYPKVSENARADLIKLVGEQMDDLIKNHLREYISRDKEKYVPTSKGKTVYTLHQSRNKISNSLKAWSQKKDYRETKLSDFS